MEEYIIIRLMNNFKSIIERLNSIEIDDPLNYLREIVNQLMIDDNGLFTFEDNGQMYLFLKRISKIKVFFKEEKSKVLRSMISYLFSLIIPNVAELRGLSVLKRDVEDQFNILDLNEIILSSDEFQFILNAFSDFKGEYSEFYIRKHEEFNSLRGNFGEDLLISSEFKCLSKLSLIEQIRIGLLNPPARIRADVQEIRNSKCPIGEDELVDIIDKRPECSNCNTKFEDLFDPNLTLALLAAQHQIIKDRIAESLLTALKLINNREARINGILEEDRYREMENAVQFFNNIFEFFGVVSEERVTTAELSNNLFNLYSDEILEVLRRAFQEDPVTVIIDILEDIFNNIAPNFYDEKELNIELQEVIETAKEEKKQQKFEELELGPDDELPIVRYRFIRKEREDLNVS